MDYLQIGEIRRFGETTGLMKYDLEVLSNGLITCDVKLTNQLTDDEPVVCKALIDTGSDFSIIDTCIYKKFRIDERMIEISGLKTLHEKESNIKLYKFNVNATVKNWSPRLLYFGVHDLSDREYQIILGMNFIRTIDLVYKGSQGLAWFED